MVLMKSFNEPRISHSNCTVAIPPVLRVKRIYTGIINNLEQCRIMEINQRIKQYHCQSMYQYQAMYQWTSEQRLIGMNSSNRALSTLVNYIDSALYCTHNSDQIIYTSLYICFSLNV